MTQSTEEISRQMTQVQALIEKQAHKKAVVLLNDIIKKNPDAALAYRVLGSILMRSASPEKALPYLKKGIRLAPEDGESWKLLGYFHKKQSQWAEALEAFEQCVSYIGEEPHVLYEMVLIHRKMGNNKEALAILRNLLERSPDHTIFLWQLARLLNDMGEQTKALNAYRALVESKRTDIPLEAVKEWYGLMVTLRFVSEARVHLHLLSESNPDNVTLKNLYGLSCYEDMDSIEAKRIFEEAHRLVPEDIDILYRLAVSCRQSGDTEQAIAYLDKILERNPLHVQALYTRGNMHTFVYDDTLFDMLNRAVAKMAELSVEERALLHYLAGKAYDDIGELEEAFEHYRLGGILHANGQDRRVYVTLQRQTDRAKKTMTRTFFEQKAREGFVSEKPVFILGMPRSGTTLMEQVLSGIEGVYGAGELPYNLDILNGMDMGDYQLDFGKRKSYLAGESNPSDAKRGATLLALMEAMAPYDARRIIDKEPGNFIWLGYLHLILPNASIIHSRRHPVETCLSAYRIHFSQGQYWSDDLQIMGRYYRLYTELMAHWHSVLPKGTILDVRYEDMVTDLEGESRRIIEHIGMPWDANCLNFYQSKRPVRTASVSQVRKPIYTTSMNRWRKYEPYLKPLLDEIGDLVEAYEAELVIN